MTIMDMLGQSGVLTLLGMGIVFSFLFIMIICVSVMGKIFQALGVNKNDPALESGPAQTANPARPAAVTAAITAAVTEYRKENN